MKYFAPRFVTDHDQHVDSASHSIAMNCTENMHMPDATSATPDGMIIFTEVRKTHRACAINELGKREVTYSKNKDNRKGKAIKLGVKELIKVLKLSMCPNEEAERTTMSKEDQRKFHSFTPTYLTAAEWRSLSTTSSNSIPNSEN